MLANNEMSDDGKLKPLGPYFVGMIVDYVGKPATPARRYSLSTTRWHILQVRPQREFAIETKLEEDVFAGYCPKVKAMRAIRPHVHRPIYRPMFAGYLFVGFDVTAEDWHRISDIDDVIRLFKINLQPVPVPHFVMERVKAKELELSLPVAQKATPIMVKVNDVVRVLTGPFASFFGVISEINPKKRTLGVEMDIFGRKTPVELEVEQVEVV